MTKVIYTSLVLTLLLLMSAQKSFACSCAFSPGPEKKQVRQAFNDSTAIFSGEVLEIRDSSEDINMLLVRFKVTKLWKGELKREVTLTTAKQSAMCGYRFEIATKYLVYGNGPRDALLVTNCSRTTNASNRRDLKYLAKLKRQKRAN